MASQGTNLTQDTQGTQPTQSTQPTQGTQDDEDLGWTSARERLFLDILIEKVKRDPNGAPSFKGTDWHEIDDLVTLSTGMRFGVVKLKGKYGRFRIKYNQFTELINHTGVTFEESTGRVFAPDEVWKQFFEVLPLFLCYFYLSVLNKKMSHFFVVGAER